MKRILILLSALSLLAFLGVGCGHLFGNDPEGVTGGHEGGYGSFGSSYEGDYYPGLLLGSWQQGDPQGEYNIITFQADGALRVDFYDSNGHLQLSETGTYYISGSRMDFNVSGWDNGSGIFVINGDTMTLTKDANSTDFHRLN